MSTSLPKISTIVRTIGLYALRLEFLLQGGSDLAVALRDHGDGTLFGEMPHKRPPQSPATAGDDGDPPR